MGGRIARPGQLFSDARPLTLARRSKHWQPRDPRPQALKTTPLHTHTIPTSSFYSCVFHQKPLSTHRHPASKWIRPKSAAGAPPAPGRGEDRIY
jgi:hypothetical protein